MSGHADDAKDLTDVVPNEPFVLLPKESNDDPFNVDDIVGEDDYKGPESGRHADGEDELMDYIEGILSGRGGVYERELGIKEGEDPLAKMKLPGSGDPRSGSGSGGGSSDDDDAKKKKKEKKNSKKAVAAGAVAGAAAGAAVGTAVANSSKSTKLGGGEVGGPDSPAHTAADAAGKPEDEDMLEVLHREQEGKRLSDDAVDSLINDATRASAEREKATSERREEYKKKWMSDPFTKKNPENNPYGGTDDFDVGFDSDSVDPYGGTPGMPKRKARFGEKDDVKTYKVGQPTGAKMYGRCYSTRSEAGDIKIMVDVEGLANKKAFFIDAMTKFSGFRKAVEKKVGKLYALCYQEEGLRQLVEVDDDETFTLFIERGGTLVLIGLKREPPADFSMPNWSIHSCHAQYAGTARPLPPVDTRPAPHTTRAPTLIALSNEAHHDHLPGAYCNQCGHETTRSYGYNGLGTTYGSMLSMMTPKIRV